MISRKTHIGEINLSEGYLSKLIGNTATSCFGVVRMNPAGATQGIKKLVSKSEDLNSGVKVIASKDPGKITVDLHITVMYGVNIPAVKDSIENKVRYIVERETSLKVDGVNIFVDGMENG